MSFGGGHRGTRCAKRMFKSRLAFAFSVERLFAKYRSIYFWGFTFKWVQADDEESMRKWNLLHLRLRRRWPNMKGLRVCELHKERGIHFHCLINQWLPIKEVMAISRGNGRLTGENCDLGFGRMSVKVCNINTAQYLVKYMTKEGRIRHGRRRRLWGSIGGFKSVRKNDIVADNPFTRNKALLWPHVRLEYKTFQMLNVLTRLFGSYSQWPDQLKQLIRGYHLNKHSKRNIYFVDENGLRSLNELGLRLQCYGPERRSTWNISKE